jgi:hypothetical protein
LFSGAKVNKKFTLATKELKKLQILIGTWDFYIVKATQSG